MSQSIADRELSSTNRSHSSSDSLASSTDIVQSLQSSYSRDLGSFSRPSLPVPSSLQVFSPSPLPLWPP